MSNISYNLYRTYKLYRPRKYSPNMYLLTQSSGMYSKYSGHEVNISTIKAHRYLCLKCYYTNGINTVLFFG